MKRTSGKNAQNAGHTAPRSAARHTPRPGRKPYSVSSNNGGRTGNVPLPFVMVCLSPSPSNKRVIRAAARAALSSSAPPIALYVARTEQEAEEDTRLRENILYAKANGFEIHTVMGSDIPEAISEHARQHGITDLFLGYSPPSFFLQARRPIDEQLLHYLPSVDIHIIPDRISSSYPGTMNREAVKIPWNLQDLLRVLAIMTVATLLSVWFFHSRYSNANIITIYILGVLIASFMTSSRIYGLLAAVLYVLLFNFLFIEPRFTLLVYDSAYLVTYLVTIVAALITGNVTMRMKNIASMSAENAYQTKILLDTSNQLEMAVGNEAILQTTCMQLVHLLRRTVLFCPADSFPTATSPSEQNTADRFPAEQSEADRSILRIFPAGSKREEEPVFRLFSPVKDSAALKKNASLSASISNGAESGNAAPDDASAGEAIPDDSRRETGYPAVFTKASGREEDAIRRSLEGQCQAGAFTSLFPECACRYLCLYSGETVFGVIGIYMEDRPFTEFEHTILLSIVHECTMALENTRMAQEQKKAEIQAENERLRAGLLRSISHDLRTPLTSIYGNASNLRSHENDLPREDRNKIYKDIMEDAGWLSAQFENILSMTKLGSAGQEKGYPLPMTVENMEDVIEESLRHVADHPDQRICFTPPEEALFARMDSRLIMQVLINLLNNAVKYTPPGSDITVKACSEENRICVEVADTGPGIPDKDKPHIFDLFYTGSRPLADSYRSLGVGLNLCAQILRAHGGEIEVSDNVPSGAIFRFRLPAADIFIPEET